MVDTISTFYSLGMSTPSTTLANIDSFLMSSTALSLVNNSACIKYQVQLGLYCKTIKLLGTEKHEEDLLKAVKMSDVGAF